MSSDHVDRWISLCLFITRVEARAFVKLSIAELFSKERSGGVISNSQLFVNTRLALPFKVLIWIIVLRLSYSKPHFCLFQP
jgi:hypothetical protein